MKIVLADLGVTIGGRTLVDDVSLSLTRGARTALVGASGAGKSLTCAALAGTLTPAASVTGSLTIEDPDGSRDSAPGSDLLRVPAARRPRGARAALVQQDPATALHPLLRVGDQVAAAASANASRWRWPWPPGRFCCWPTSPRRPLTSSPEPSTPSPAPCAPPPARRLWREPWPPSRPAPTSTTTPSARSPPPSPRRRSARGPLLPRGHRTAPYLPRRRGRTSHRPARRRPVPGALRERHPAGALRLRQDHTPQRASPPGRPRPRRLRRDPSRRRARRRRPPTSRCARCVPTVAPSSTCPRTRPAASTRVTTSSPRSPARSTPFGRREAPTSTGRSRSLFWKPSTCPGGAGTTDLTRSPVDRRSASRWRGPSPPPGRAGLRPRSRSAPPGPRPALRTRRRRRLVPARARPGRACGAPRRAPRVA